MPPSLPPSSSDSASDSDFDPNPLTRKQKSHNASPSSSSFDSDSEAPRQDHRKKLKRIERAGADDEAQQLGSGDEETVRRGRKKRKKQMDMVEGTRAEEGEGRRMRTRHTAGGPSPPPTSTNTAPTTVDVDALWARVNSGPPKPPPIPTPAPAASTPVNTPPQARPKPLEPLPEASEETITITRTYTFAGKTTTEQKIVPKSSAEAQLHLQSLPGPQNTPNPHPALRKPKKRSSKFDPGRSPAALSAGTASKAPKLNTIEKSKMDWAGYVDAEGMKEELDGAGRAKEGYLGKMDFLGRVEAKREGERRGGKG